VSLLTWDGQTDRRTDTEPKRIARYSIASVTSCFHSMGPMGRIKHDVAFRRVRQVAVPVERQTTIQCLVEFVRVRHWGRSLLSMIALSFACLFDVDLRATLYLCTVGVLCTNSNDFVTSSPFSLRVLHLNFVVTLDRPQK